MIAKLYEKKLGNLSKTKRLYKECLNYTVFHVQISRFFSDINNLYILYIVNVAKLPASYTSYNTTYK